MVLAELLWVWNSCQSSLELSPYCAAVTVATGDFSTMLTFHFTFICFRIPDFPAPELTGRVGFDVLYELDWLERNGRSHATNRSVFCCLSDVSNWRATACMGGLMCTPPCECLFVEFCSVIS